MMSQHQNLCYHHFPICSQYSPIFEAIEDVGPRGAPAPQVASQASTGAFTALSSKADAAVASAKPGYDVSKCHHPSFHGFVS